MKHRISIGRCCCPRGCKNLTCAVATIALDISNCVDCMCAYPPIAMPMFGDGEYVGNGCDSSCYDTKPLLQFETNETQGVLTILVDGFTTVMSGEIDGACVFHLEVDSSDDPQCSFLGATVTMTDGPCVTVCPCDEEGTCPCLDGPVPANVVIDIVEPPLIEHFDSNICRVRPEFLFSSWGICEVRECLWVGSHAVDLYDQDLNLIDVCDVTFPEGCCVQDEGFEPNPTAPNPPSECNVIAVPLPGQGDVYAGDQVTLEVSCGGNGDVLVEVHYTQKNLNFTGGTNWWTIRNLGPQPVTWGQVVGDYAVMPGGVDPPIPGREVNMTGVDNYDLSEGLIVRIGAGGRSTMRAKPMQARAYPCKHRGERVTQMRRKSCMRPEDVYKCDIFGRCSMRRVSHDIEPCLGCDKRER